jgi:hypothetical protein
MANRRSYPKILDIGWCEAPTPTLEDESQMPKHIAIKENQHLRNPGKNDASHQLGDFIPSSPFL